jgi:serine/threonine protein kinase
MERIGKYKIHGEMGRGAMGIVYRGEDPIIGRAVAIKTIRFDLLSGSAERENAQIRFMREARSAGNLSHPNIVTIYDVGEDEGLTYIAMEFIDGRSLDEHLAGGRRFALGKAIDLMEKIGDALDYAHRKGVIHRDIKPANILIDREGLPYLADFGIARIATSTMTQTHTVMGTPYYMSPEQIEGKKVDGRADIFSLGAVFYEMLTLQKPFPGDNITTVIYKIVNEPHTPVRRLLEDLPEGLDTMLSRALAKNPENRYSTCAQFIRDLRRPQPFGEMGFHPDRFEEEAFPYQGSRGIPEMSTWNGPENARMGTSYEPPQEEDPYEPPAGKRRTLLFILAAMIAVIGVVLSGVYLLENRRLSGVSHGSGGISFNAPTAQEQISAGRDFLNNSRLEDARGRFEKALDLEPGNYEARINLAEILLREGRKPEALELFEELAGDKNADLRPYRSLAEIFEELGDVEKALDYYRLCAAIAQEGKEVEDFNVKVGQLEARLSGPTLEEQGLLDIAGKNPPAQIQPEELKAETVEVKTEKNRETSGRDVRTEGVEQPDFEPGKNPANKKDPEPVLPVPEPGPIFSEGLSLFNREEYSGAVEKMKEVVRMDPGHTEAKYYMAVAERRLAAQIQRRENEAQVLNLLRSGREYLGSGEYAAVIQKARQVLSLDKGNEEARQLLSRAEALAVQAREKAFREEIFLVFEAYKSSFADGRMDDFYKEYSVPELYRKMGRQAQMLTNLYKNFQSDFSQPELSDVLEENGRYTRATLRFIQAAIGESKQGERGEIINGAYTWEMRWVGRSWRIFSVSFSPRR